MEGQERKRWTGNSPLSLCECPVFSFSSIRVPSNSDVRYVMESPFRSEEIPEISSLDWELQVPEDELFNILSTFSRNEEVNSQESHNDQPRSSGNDFTSSDVLLSGTSQSSCESNTPSPRNDYETTGGYGNSRRSVRSSITLFSSNSQISPVTFNANHHPSGGQGGSPNSNHSAMSLDSAIGDVYSVQTPSRSSIDGDADKIDLSSVLVTSAPRSSHGRVISPVHNQRVARRRRSRQSSPFGYSRQSGPVPSQQIFPSPQLNATVQDLCHKYHMAFYSRPRPRPKNLGDPLYVTNRLVSDAMVRFQRFFANLDAVQTLPISDMNLLYNTNICVVAIIRACAMSTNLSTLLDAFPFPYGQNLQAEEALFLIFSNNLYTELKAFVTKVQASSLLKDVQVMIFCMILGFFNAVPDILAHHQVYDSQHFYKQKLMEHLSVVHGSLERAQTDMKIIEEHLEAIRQYAHRLRDFMSEVIKYGLQDQYEPICENIGLICFLIQNDPSMNHLGCPRPPVMGPRIHPFSYHHLS
ncbi:uncharacterized protein LOC131880337 [Tigriopus californicus]|uniref:uncharacterized protein LOC131880337 n=1 Tax=Tigriopus californicus TaxID=6832 RepID=UPI0027DA032B|nr:uncharacterized protein LOC131880337 [Tigriopus californicus]